MRELVLTGLKDFWPEDETNAVFLGPWCFAGNHKYKFWDQRSFTLAPSPWKNPQDILAASQYIDSLIERIIPPLSMLMNSFHGVRYSDRFWKIHTIHWLLHWLNQCYDRYQRLKYFEQTFDDVFVVKILDERIDPAKDFADYRYRMTYGHYYNLLLMSDIIRNGQFGFILRLYDLMYKAENKESLPDNTEKSSFRQKMRRKLIDGLRLGRMKNSIINNLGASIHIGCVNGFSIIDYLYLQFSCEPFFLFKKRSDRDLAEIRKTRSDFNKITFEFDASNRFEEMVENTILRYVPDALMAIYYRRGNNGPEEKCWIGNDLYHSEKMSYRIAEICEHGGKWISSQHGGGYGNILSFPYRKIEYETSGGFITWGWEGDEKDSCPYYPLPSPSLSKLPAHTQKKDQLIYVGTTETPYLFRLHSKLTPECLLDYMENNYRFFHKLDGRILSKSIYRPYPINFGTDIAEFVCNKLSDGRLLQGKMKLTDAFKRSRLAVIDHMETSFLEALSMNTPTILFWNPGHFVECDSAVPYFNELRSAGILFNTPEAAADKVNIIWEDVQGWWNQQQVQKARNEFCHKFARTSNKWRKEWVQFLKKLKTANSKSQYPNNE